MKLLVVSATSLEIAPYLQGQDADLQEAGPGFWSGRGNRPDVLVTGVGCLFTAFHLGRQLMGQEYDLAINIGVAGGREGHWKPGDVVRLASERLGDLGVEEQSGAFTDIFDLRLLDPRAAPFTDGRLMAPEDAGPGFLPRAHGLTVNRVHGSRDSIDALFRKYPDASVETMEGAAFFYACLLAGVPFLAIRGISNLIEPRQRDNWRLELAIENSNRVLAGMIDLILNGIK